MSSTNGLSPDPIGDPISPNSLHNGNGNTPVHSFDPDASPEQKAAAAGKARDALRSVKDSSTAAPESGRGKL